MSPALALLLVSCVYLHLNQMHSPKASTQVLGINENGDNRNGHSESNHIRTQALTSKQERKLIDYIEDKFLDITRNFKKR